MRICTNVIIIVILLFSVNTAVADPFVELISISGDNLQGNLQHGWIHSDVIKIKINNQEIPIQNGHFILGFDRDAPLDNALTIIMIDGDSLSLSYPIDKRNYQIDRINNLEKTYVSGSSDEDWKNRVNREAEKLRAAWQMIYTNNKRYYQNFKQPVPGDRISSLFGSQRILNGIAKKPHNGVDIAVPRGTDVHSTSDGVIALTGDFYYLGKCVIVDHGSGLGSLYAHLDSVFVNPGEFVTSDTIIGEVGSTGRSTGPHLHWGVMWMNNRIDPMSLLEFYHESTYKIKSQK